MIRQHPPHLQTFTRSEHLVMVIVDATTEEELDRAALKFTAKGWDIWIRDNTGRISMVFCKPVSACPADLVARLRAEHVHATACGGAR